MRHKLKWWQVIIRFWRHFTGKCWVCGRGNVGKHYYCSFLCSGSDGTFSVNPDHPNNKRKPSFFRGHYRAKPKPHHEKDYD